MLPHFTGRHTGMILCLRDLAMGYYHVCSDGNSAAVLFGNEADFKAAMNRVAICATGFPITILAFVLMGNHFHFVMRCDSEDTCRAFISEFKRLTGRYNSMMNRESTSLRSIEVKVIPVTDIDYLRTLVCYVLKNPTKARLDSSITIRGGQGMFTLKVKCHTSALSINGLVIFPSTLSARCSIPVGFFPGNGLFVTALSYPAIMWPEKR